ncbi:prealbumin-like fold domain-containing protein [Alloscardovia venturai]|uniref:Prealbumin-like fold domain-containing protein n=1 Tax=Alloscardovia venturai TaxID=1769421 RepID=A0ABW2Y807_9BIFI
MKYNTMKSVLTGMAALITVFFVVLVSFTASAAHAQDTSYTLNIHIKNYDAIYAAYGGSTSTNLQMWEVPSSALAENRDIQDTFQKLHEKTQGALDATYSAVQVPVTFMRDGIHTSNVKQGIFYVRGSFPTSDNLNKFEFMVDTRDAGTSHVIDIDAKSIVENPHAPTGNYYFLKVGDDAAQTPLSGAVFKVYTYDKVTHTYSDVMVSGKALTVTSDKNGEFHVSDLPYGNYALEEAKAPDGFVKLNGYVHFTIDSSTNQGRKHKVLVIENHRKPNIPPLAKTGASVIAIALIAVLFVSLGIAVYRKKYQRI